MSTDNLSLLKRLGGGKTSFGIHLKQYIGHRLCFKHRPNIFCCLVVDIVINQE